MAAGYDISLAGSSSASAANSSAFSVKGGGSGLTWQYVAVIGAVALVALFIFLKVRK